MQGNAAESALLNGLTLAQAALIAAAALSAVPGTVESEKSEKSTVPAGASK